MQPGRYSYSKTISVSATDDHVFNVFPNPVKNRWFMSLPGGSAETSIRIVNINGTMVRALKRNAGIVSTSIDVTDLPAGIYSIIFDSGKLKEALQFIMQ